MGSGKEDFQCYHLVRSYICNKINCCLKIYLISGMRLQLKTVQVIIVATAILHNICRDMNEDLPEDSSDDVLHQLNEAEDMAETDHRHDDNGEDSITRNSLLNNYFAR